MRTLLPRSLSRAFAGNSGSRNRKRELLRRALQLESLETRRVFAAVTTDRGDYLPGETVQIAASAFQPGEAIRFQVVHTDGRSNSSPEHCPWVVVDGSAQDLDQQVNGKVSTQWYVTPDDSLDSRFLLTALGLASNELSSTTFTDAAADKSSQFANKPNRFEYTNGNLNSTISAYTEGASVPYRYFLADGTEDGTLVMEIKYDYVHTSSNALDFLTSDNTTESLNDLNRFGPDSNTFPLNFGLTTPLNSQSIAIPDDPNITADNSYLKSRSFLIASTFPFTVTNVTVPALGAGSEDKVIQITIKLGNDGDAIANESNADFALFFGAHLASDADYPGSSNGAADMQGAGVHMRIAATLNGDKLTSGELTLQPSAVVPTSFAWEKRRDDTQALQGGATFLITPNPLTGIGSMTVVDNGVGDADPIAGQFLFDGPLFGTYLVQETASPGGFIIDDNPVRSITVDMAHPTPSIGTQGAVDSGNTNTSDFFNIPQTFIAVQKVTVDGPALGDTLTINAGESITWRYTVTNPSQTSLGSITVVDTDTTLTPSYQSGDTDSDNLLDPTETWIYEATGSAKVGNYTNVGTASGAYRDSSGVSHTSSASDGSSYFGANPKIAINKVTVDGTTEGDNLNILTGEGLKWRYYVSAVGNVSLSTIGVVDSGSGVSPGYVSGDANSNTRLDIGEVWIYEASGIAVTGPYSNQATATGSFTDSALHISTTSSTDSSSYIGANPQLTIDKTIIDGAGSGDNKTILVGEPITWQYTVRNVGNVALRNVFVNDLPLGSITSYTGDVNSNGIMETSEVWVFTKSGTAVIGNQSNTGTASGEYIDSAGHIRRDTESDASGYFGANPKLAMNKVTVLDNVSGDNLTVKSGENIKWEYRVTNTGNVPMTVISVTDSKSGIVPSYISGDTNNDGKVDTTETWLYRATGVAVAGDYSNLGTVTGSFSDSAGHTQSVSASDPSNYFGANIQIGIDKVTVDGSQSGDGLSILVGKNIGWRYTVTNQGNVELSNVLVSDSVGSVLPGYQSGDTDLDNKLDTNEIWIYTASGTATVGSYSNLGTASGGYTDSDGHTHSSTDSDASSYNGADPQIAIQKVTNDGGSKGDGKSILVGESIKWEYTVTNVGNVPLSSVKVTDSVSGVTPVYQSGDTNGNNKLDLSEVWLFEASGTAVKGNYSNTGTASGSYTDAAGATRSDVSTDGSSYNGAQPGILMTKVTVYGAASGDGLTVEIGKPIFWRYTVVNTGNVPLANVKVTDDGGVTPVYDSGDINGNSVLDTSEIWFFTASGISIAGNYTNVGLAKGSYTDSAGHVSVPSYSDSSSYFGGVPAVSIIKTTKDGAINSDNFIILAGETIDWNYVVSNAGTLPVASIVVTDSQGVVPVYQSGDTNGNSLLDVGEQWSYSASGTAIKGPYENQGVVTGVVNESGGSVPVSATDVSTYYGAEPLVSITKVTVDKGLPVQDLYGDGLTFTAGEAIAWRYTISNLGNVSLKIDNVKDSMPGVSPVYVSGDDNSDGFLDIEENWVYEANGLATVGDYNNTGTVTASFIDSAGHARTDTASDNSWYFGAQPLISIIKETVDGSSAGDGNNILTGEVISWRYTVKNVGNVGLQNVNVNDTPLGAITSFVGDTNSNGILEKDETWVYTKSGTSIQELQSNTGIAYGEFIDASGHRSSHSASDQSSYFGANPQIAIDKVTVHKGAKGDNLTVLNGENINWEYSVRNTGNVPLTGITVSDNQAGVSPIYIGGDTNLNGLLESPEVWLFRAVGTAIVGHYNNTGTASGSFTDSAGDKRTATNTDGSSYFGAAPALKLDKVTFDGPVTGDGLMILTGENIGWIYTLSNLGNVSLSSISVSDSVVGGTVYQSGDTNANSILETDEVWVFTALGTATSGSYSNIGNASGIYRDSAGDDHSSSASDGSSYYGAEPKIGISKETVDGPARGDGLKILAGDSIVWEYTVVNQGNVPLSEVVVTDSQSGVSPQYVSGDANQDGLLDLDEKWIYQAAGTAAAGFYSNVGEAKGSFTDSDLAKRIVTNTDSSSYFGSNPQVNLVKITSDGSFIGDGINVIAGEALVWKYLVFNTGNEPLSGITITDSVAGVVPQYIGGDINGDSILDLREVWLYEAYGTAVVGNYSNTGTVVGSYKDTAGHQGIATSSDDSSYFGADPKISITKDVIDGTTSGDGLNILVGESITWRYTVKNMGNVALKNIIVNDAPLGAITNFTGDTNSNSELDTTEVWTFTRSGIAEIGTQTNIGTVSGDYFDSAGHLKRDTQFDSSSYYGADPQISIEKVTVDASVSGDNLNVLAGESIKWRYNVRNVGNIALSNLSVTDSVNGVVPVYVSGDSNSDGRLQVDEIWVYEATGTAIEGSYSNLGSVQGKYVDDTGHSREDSASDESSYYGASPSIAITKVTFDGATSGDALDILVGESIGWRYTITNAGNIPLGNVNVTDSVAGILPAYVSGDLNGNFILELDETWIYEAYGTAVKGNYSNTGKVVGAYFDSASHGKQVDAQDSSSYFGADPRISINKQTVWGALAGDNLTILSGEPIKWRYTVTNSGNISLSGVGVKDSDASVLPSYVGGDTDSNGLLDLSETWIYEAKSTAGIGVYSNTGTATAGFTDDSGHRLEDSASDDSSYFGAVRSITVKKFTNGHDADVAPGPLVSFDSVVTWTFVVTNSGNISLSNISLIDDNGTPTNTADDWAPQWIGGDTNGNSLLDTTEVWTYSATGKAVRGQYENWGYVSASSPFANPTRQAADVFAKDPSHYYGQPNLVVIAPDKGSSSVPIVRVIDADSGVTVSSFAVYEPNFLGGVRLATADMDGDGVEEIITAPGRGRLPEIRVYKQDGTELTKYRTLAFGGGYIGGIEVAAGDVNGDGYVDFVAVPSGMSTEVRVFLHNTSGSDPIPDVPSKIFKVFPSTFLGGADVAVADFGKFGSGGSDPDMLDGKSEIVVSNGPGMVSTVYVFDVTGSPTVVDTIMPFNSAYKGGVTLDVSRVTGSDIPDLIFSAGNTGQSVVEIWSGKTNDSPDVRLQQFATFANQSTVNMPVHSVGIDKTGDGVVDKILAVQGTNGLSNQVRSFSPNGTNYVVLPTLHPGFWNIDSLKTPLSPIAQIVNQPTTIAPLMESNQPNPNLLTSIAPGMNPREPLDVNADGVVNSMDVLVIINYMNYRSHSYGNSTQSNYVDGLLTKPDGKTFFMDVNCDRLVSAMDPLRVINFLNSAMARNQSNWLTPPLSSPPEGEGQGSQEGEGEGYYPAEILNVDRKDQESLTSSSNPSTWKWANACDSVINEIEEDDFLFDEALEVMLSKLR